MSDLPADVQDVINQFVKPEFKDVARLVALRAILTERERCAKVAERAGHWGAQASAGMFAPPNGSPAVWVGLDGPSIASAIRGGDNAE